MFQENRLEQQQTVVRSFTLEGVGIHTGERGRITVHPAEINTGRIFYSGGVTFPARADYVVDTTRCTVLGHNGVRISTVEHLLSALHASGIDNALIEVEGPEIPILDGSALPFTAAIDAAGGVVGQGTPWREVVVCDDFRIEQGNSSYTISPFEGFALQVNTAFDAWPEGTATDKRILYGWGAAVYREEIAPARTFAFEFEVQALIAAGLAKGGSLDNALIITPPDGFSTPLRVPQEWCAHKALDVIGDLALVDARIRGRFVAELPGHRINVAMAQALLQQAA